MLLESEHATQPRREVAGYISPQALNGLAAQSKVLTAEIRHCPHDKANRHGNGLAGTDGAITWKLTEQTPQQGWSQGDKKAYKLTITGKGVMPGYMHMPDGVNTPWQPYNDQIQTIAVAKGVTRVSEHAFEGMGELTSVTLPSTVTQVSREAFMYCQKLKKITLPEALENIGDRAFNYCRALTSIVVQEQVTTIGSLAFAGCDSLESVSLGESVAQVQGFILHGCGKL